MFFITYFERQSAVLRASRKQFFLFLLHVQLRANMGVLVDFSKKKLKIKKIKDLSHSCIIKKCQSPRAL